MVGDGLDLLCRVAGLGLQVCGLGLEVESSMSRIEILGFRVDRVGMG